MLAIKREAERVFRSDHPRFEYVGWQYEVPNGDPSQWTPEDQYEEFNPTAAELRGMKRYYENVRQQVYDINAGEAESVRRERAESAFIDAQDKVGVFVVARNILLDGCNLISVQSGMTGANHAFGVSRGKSGDMKSLRTIGTSEDAEGIQHLVQSPACSLKALCGIEPREPECDVYGNFYPNFTDSNVLCREGEWHYVFYALPPEK